MTVWSAMLVFFPTERFFVQFVGFQVSMEKTTSADSTLSSISPTVLVVIFDYDSDTIYFSISVAALRCGLLSSTIIGLVVQECYFTSVVFSLAWCR